MGESDVFLTGAAVIVVRRKGSGIEVLTQTRNASRKPDDKIYDNTEECVGERSLSLENVLRTAKRGVEEETRADGECKILGSNGKRVDPLITTTGRGDAMMVVDPYTFFQTLKGSRPRFAPCFIAIVPEFFEPRLDDAGEVNGFHWWEPEELLVKLRTARNKFSFMHPVLLKFCIDIVEKGLRLEV